MKCIIKHRLLKSVEMLFALRRHWLEVRKVNEIKYGIEKSLKNKNICHVVYSAGRE